ncbi:MAG: hypothetical protein HY700_08910 [Gemmatimonadetes bacterium]|nr:hypothetical protein [Gemmatimonadota bacterium]
MNQDNPEPLPREWLPESASAFADRLGVEPFLLRRLLGAAEPLLARYRAEDARWWAPLATRWRPMLAGAGAAAALVLGFAVERAVLPASETPDPVLAASFSDGDLPLFWNASHGGADPVLTVVALQEGIP